MYFKRLEMTGFKSFADRTVLKLEEGITSIVGPNGCGKSNILDAMRWALGEQKPKELRGSHMQDVIFNGSDTRHAMGMAEVSLTFDNADSKLPVDFAEVEITRRVYRSGESEYLINKAPCRLSDIRDLFMDTGIGTSAYSMVGQGKMDQILSAKADERRAVFEEAAGVHKYKSRKRIAVRRLDSAEQNLLRLADIITEVQRQMRSLKRQVNAAIRYRELSDQLREIEIRSAWIQYTHLSKEIERLRAEFTKAQDAYEKLSSETSQREARSEELHLKRLELQRVLTTRREGVYELDTNMEKIERQIALLRQQIEFAEQKRAQGANERTAFLAQAETLKTNIVAAEARVGELDAESTTRNSALDEKTSAHAQLAEEALTADAKVKGLRETLAEHAREHTKAVTDVETLGVRLNNVSSQIENLLARQDADNTRRGELATALETLQREETECQGSLGQETHKRTEAVEQREAQEASLREGRESRQSARDRLSRIEERLASLRELRDNYEGFAAGVRAVMKAKTDNREEASGIIGPVGDLISTEKQYERAIEAALGGSINNVVVNDAEGAKGAIAYLKKNNAGRVTFLPLDIIRGGKGDTGDSIRSEQGVIGPALEVVQFEEGHRNAVEYTLHSTLLVETLDDAIRIARSGKRHPRLVTLEGEMVTSAGAVTGGRTQHQSRGLLGRSAEITELEEKSAAATTELEQLDAQCAAWEESIRTLSTAIAEHDGAISKLQSTLRDLHLAGARHNTDLERLNEILNDRGTDLERLNEQREGFAKDREEALARADTIETGDQALQRELAEAEERANASRQALSAQATELADLRVALASISQRREEAQRDLQRERESLEHATREAERRVEIDATTATEITRLNEQIAENLERSKALSESKEEAQATVVEAENEHQKALAESEEVDKRLKLLREQDRDAQTKVHTVELALRRDEERVGFFQERILSEYNIALSSLSADEVGTDDMEDDVREKLVSEIRQKLQRMGDVNLMAIEEYEELEKRHDFLEKQHDDLQNARAALLEVIERSDKKIRELFMHTFNEVSNSFRETFRRMFGGGQARVYLLDEDDPLESGIEIEARPPGKKPQSISLLSGGERALTAVALLFAIFQTKPSPFCVLDEVDAPLDDANIGRFCEMVVEFAESSQFIVITHNKQTMGHADILYGVTQQERGVSELVSVRFEEGSGTAA